MTKEIKITNNFIIVLTLLCILISILAWDKIYIPITEESIIKETSSNFKINLPDSFPDNQSVDYSRLMKTSSELKYTAAKNKEYIDTTFFENTSFKDWKDKYYSETIINNYVWVRDEVYYALGGSVNDLGTTQNSLEVLKSKTGNCLEQSILLISLLRSMDVKAYLFIIPEDNHAIVGVSYEDYNCSICTTNSSYVSLKNLNQNGYIFLDPTCKNCDLNKPYDLRNKTLEKIDYYTFPKRGNE